MAKQVSNFAPSQSAVKRPGVHSKCKPLISRRVKTTRKRIEVRVDNISYIRALKNF